MDTQLADAVADRTVIAEYAAFYARQSGGDRSYRDLIVDAASHAVNSGVKRTSYTPLLTPRAQRHIVALGRCVPCPNQVAPGEDPRAGRWRGWDKTECGIHEPVF